MIKYRTYYDGEIKLVEIGKETNNFVTLLNGNRQAKISEYHCYFDTLDEAKKYLIDKFDTLIARSEYAMNMAIEKKQRVIDYKDVQS